MTTGAIAYRELQQNDHSAVDRVIKLLQANPNDRNDGAVLPTDYIDKAKTVAQKRVVLAGYRLADLLEQLF